MKLRLQKRLKKLRDHHLSDAIGDRWYSQRSRLPIAFWYFHTPYRHRKVASRRQPIPEFIEIR
jgi:hypothetical protein